MTFERWRGLSCATNRDSSLGRVVRERAPTGDLVGRLVRREPRRDAAEQTVSSARRAPHAPGRVLVAASREWDIPGRVLVATSRDSDHPALLSYATSRNRAALARSSDAPGRGPYAPNRPPRRFVARLLLRIAVRKVARASCSLRVAVRNVAGASCPQRVARRKLIGRVSCATSSNSKPRRESCSPRAASGTPGANHVLYESRFVGSRTYAAATSRRSEHPGLLLSVTSRDLEAHALRSAAPPDPGPYSPNPD